VRIGVLLDTQSATMAATVPEERLSICR